MSKPYPALCARLAAEPAMTVASKMTILCDVAWARGEPEQTARLAAIDALYPVSPVWQAGAGQLGQIWDTRWRLLDSVGA